MTDYTVVRQVISNFLEVNFEDANVWTSNLHFWIPYSFKDSKIRKALTNSEKIVEMSLGPLCIAAASYFLTGL